MTAKPRSLGSLLANALLITVSLLWLVPLVFTVLVSLRPSSQPITNGNVFFGCAANDTSQAASSESQIPFLGCVITPQNYLDAWQVSPWLTHYANSLIFVFGTLIVQLITITMAGYAFARM